MTINTSSDFLNHGTSSKIKTNDSFKVTRKSMRKKKPITTSSMPTYNHQQQESWLVSTSNAIWEKILYKHQGVPDNYVPPTFLKGLRKNVNLRRFHLMEVIIAASFITQQIVLIVILIMMFIYFNCYENRYDQILFTIVTIITLLLYLFILISSKLQEMIQIKTCLIFLIACFIMNPVLKTLTETISTDTIYLQCAIMTFIHLIFHDYGLNISIVSRPISLNAIFFASVCLASRLYTTYHAFAFLVFSIDLFVLISFICKTLELRIKLLLTVIFIIFTLLLVKITFGLIGFFVSIMFLFFINFVCPYIFLRMQSLKENIYGPWDEAIIDPSKLKFSLHRSNNNNNYYHSEFNREYSKTSESFSFPSSPVVLNINNIFKYT